MHALPHSSMREYTDSQRHPIPTAPRPVDDGVVASRDTPVEFPEHARGLRRGRCDRRVPRAVTGEFVSRDHGRANKDQGVGVFHDLTRL